MADATDHCWDAILPNAVEAFTHGVSVEVIGQALGWQAGGIDGGGWIPAGAATSVGSVDYYYASKIGSIGGLLAWLST